MRKHVLEKYFDIVIYRLKVNLIIWQLFAVRQKCLRSFALAGLKPNEFLICISALVLVAHIFA